MSKNIIKIIIAVLFLGGCASHKKNNHNKAPKKIAISLKQKKKSLRSKAIVQKITKKYAGVNKPKVIIKKKLMTKKITDFSLEYHQKHYRFWINYFGKNNKARFKRFLNNGIRYKKTIDRILKEEGLPQELYYVGLIESGYQNHIRSKASAVGSWQFIKGTATRYGLRVDRQVDERQNIFKATRAAARYFKDLYNIFGSWELALCAYNAGEYRIINAIRKGNTRDYRELVAKKLIPRETIYYIPKVAAAKYLSKKRHFKVKREKDTRYYYSAKSVQVKKSFSLQKVAQGMGLGLGNLKRLNPDIRQRSVKVRRRGHELFVPAQHYKVAKNYVHRFLNKKSNNKKAKRRIASRPRIRYYRVKAGDHLSRLSKRFGVSINALKRHNKISSNNILVGQRLKIPSPTKRHAKTKRKIYIVKKGDNLYRIAQRFGTSIDKIKALNNISRKTIYPTQRLWLPHNKVL